GKVVDLLVQNSQSCCRPCRMKFQIGSVVQRRACCASSFDVKDEGGQLVLTIDGPFIACGRNVEFPVTTPSGTPSGNITKKWRGFLREDVHKRGYVQRV
ncbi:hypothetical protein OSTOST_23228, partial [Ostertagia ostertagi]